MNAHQRRTVRRALERKLPIGASVIWNPYGLVYSNPPASANYAGSIVGYSRNYRVVDVLITDQNRVRSCRPGQVRLA